MSIINYEKLEEPIRNIEKELSEYDNEEKALILRQINSRFKSENQKRRVNENLHSLDLMSLVKKSMKGGE